jgi:hypothetical protein
MTDDIVARLLAVDHQCVEDCFLKSPLFAFAAAESERLRAKQEDLANLLADAYGSIMDWDEVLKERANYEAVCQIERLRAALLEIIQKDALTGETVFVGDFGKIARAALEREKTNAAAP